MLVCAYCGGSEPLPADLHDRVFVIRTLATGRSWSEDPLRGKLVAWLVAFEAPGFRAILERLKVLGVIYVGFSLFAALRGDSFSTLRRAHIPGLTAAQLLQAKTAAAYQLTFWPSMVVAIGLAVGIGLARARGLLQREIAPLVVATQPETFGAPEQCRRCGADLPHAHNALRDCLYCRAANVVSESGVLRALVAAVRTRAQQTSPEEAAKRFTKIETRLHREWKVTLVLGVVAAPAIAWAGRHLLLALVR